MFESETEDINQQHLHIWTVFCFYKPHLGFSSPLCKLEGKITLLYTVAMGHHMIGITTSKQ